MNNQLLEGFDNFVNPNGNYVERSPIDLINEEIAKRGLTNNQSQPERKPAIVATTEFSDNKKQLNVTNAEMGKSHAVSNNKNPSNPIMASYDTNSYFANKDNTQNRNSYIDGLNNALLEHELNTGKKTTADYLDLTPLMAWADQMGGTQYAKSYKAPTTKEEDRNRQATLQKMIADYKDKQFDNQINLLKVVNDNENKKEMLDLKEKLASNKRDPMLDWLAKEQWKRDNALAKAPNADQSKAGTFATRLVSAENDLASVAERFNRTKPFSAVVSNNYFPELLTPELAKMQRQAEKNFMTAILRRESGASISDTEFKTAESQYFPRVGDTPAVLEQKRRNRLDAIAGMKAEAGDEAMRRIGKALNEIPQK